MSLRGNEGIKIYLHELLEELDDVAGLLDDIEHGYAETNPKLAKRAARASAKARAAIAKATGKE